MSTFYITINNIAMLFICMMIGFFSKKKGLINDDAQASLSNLLVKVTLPSYVIYSLQRPYSKELFLQSVTVVFVSTFVYLLGTLVAFLFCKLLKVPKKDAGVYMISLTLSNVVYMGAPVLSAIYGKDAYFYTYMASVPFQIVAFTLGIKLITHGYDREAKINFKSIFTNPAVDAAFVGLFLFLFSIKLPDFLNNTLLTVGSMTTPISMIIIGYILAKSDLMLFFKNKTMYFFIFLRLIIMPLILFFLFRNFISEESLFGVLVLIAAMPSAAITAILASQYKTNELLTSQMVCASTIISLITIPTISLLLQYK